MVCALLATHCRQYSSCMENRLSFYVCNRCRFTALAKSRPLTRSNRQSSLASTKSPLFTSFFFHNDQWTSFPRAGRPPSINYSAQSIASSAPPRASYRDNRHTLSVSRTLKLYAELSKSRLTVLVVLTAMSGVALSPLPTTVSVLLSTGLGTALCSASANTLNQIQEMPFDAQMARTRTRALVRRAISPLHATAFAVVTGLAGPAILWTMVNPTTAILGAVNIGLYAGLYTYLKRKSIVNTWVGAVVGGLPPLMGWTACGGHLLPSPDNPPVLFLPSFLSSVDPAAIDLSLIDNPLSPLALFMFLFSWQLAHFNAFSHFVRDSYAQAGFRMLSVTDPAKNSRVALRHALLFIPLCSTLTPLSGLTTWAFALTSLVPNAVFVRAVWRFWRTGGDKEARTAFHHSLWYLPVIMGLMMVHKQGMKWAEWLGLSETPDSKESLGSSSVKQDVQ